MKTFDRNSEAYELFKSEAVAPGRFTRKEVGLSEIEVLSAEVLRYGGYDLHMSIDAFKALVKHLGLSQRFLKDFGNSMGAESISKMVNMMRLAMQRHETKSTVCLVFDKGMRVINVTKSARAVLSPGAFFNLVEDVMNVNPEMRIKHMSMSAGGNVEISVINPNWEFQVAGLKDELFHSGITYVHTPDAVILNPFNERLVCSNGMVVQDRGLSMVLRNSDQASVNGFFDTVRSIRDMSYFEEEFKKRVLKMMATTASYSELLHCRKNFESEVDMSDDVHKSQAERFFPVEMVKSEYARVDMDLSVHDEKLFKMVKTNMTVWELVNEITDLSSHADRYGIRWRDVSDRAVFRLQKLAGELTFKDPLDLEWSGVPDVFK